MSDYTDKQRKNIALREYGKPVDGGESVPYQVGDSVEIDDAKAPVGYVSQVVDDSLTGLQAYVVTDAPAGAPAGSVGHVAVLYQGSRDTLDWVQNDIPVGVRALIYPLADPLDKDSLSHTGETTPQFIDSSRVLKDAMKRYPNAQFDVYGHSLGSMDGQYALSDLNEDEAKRVSGAWLYEGPNIYSMLNKRQRKRAGQLTATGRIRNYSDSKDIVSFGYGASAQGIVGTLKRVASTKAGGISSQHNFGGYVFMENGTLKLDAGLQSVWDVVDGANADLDGVEKKLRKANGGGLTGGEEIWLDEERAGNIASGMNILMGDERNELNALTDEAKAKMDEEWRGALSDASFIGPSLSYGEVLSALAAGGATEESVAGSHKGHFDEVSRSFDSAVLGFNDLAGRIDAAVSAQVASDGQLAVELKSVGC